MKNKYGFLRQAICVVLAFFVTFTTHAVQVLRPTGILDRPPYIVVQLNSHERINQVDIYRGMPLDGWQTLVLQVEIPVDLQDDTVYLDVNT